MLLSLASRLFERQLLDMLNCNQVNYNLPDLAILNMSLQHLAHLERIPIC